jgi:hypothetical protein
VCCCFLLPGWVLLTPEPGQDQIVFVKRVSWVQHWCLAPQTSVWLGGSAELREQGLELGRDLTQGT